MTIRSNINPKYLIRLGIVTTMCIGMCLYCIKDGAYTWPDQAKHAEEYQQYRDDNPGMSEKEHAEQWDETRGLESGWMARDLKEARTVYEFNQQFAMAGLTGLIGLFFVAKLLGNMGCWVEATEAGLTTSERRQVAFDNIAALDKKKWDNKGIAYVRYEENGKKKSILLDDCNYERDTTQQILRLVEEKIDVEKIVNGNPEPPLEDKQDNPASADGETQSFTGEPTKV